MSRAAGAALLIALLPAAAAPSALRPAAALDAYPLDAPGAAASPVSIEELARLVDLDALALSPDGGRVAFRLLAPDPLANIVRTGWFVVPTTGGRPRPIGPGGDLELGQLPDGLMFGGIRPPEARWSPDGRRIAYSYARGGVRGVRVAGADGMGVRTLRRPADIRRFWWQTPDMLGVATDARSRAAQAAARAAGRRDGVLFAGRFTPGVSSAPRELASLATGRFTFDVSSGLARPGAAEPATGPADPAVRLAAASPQGWVTAQIADPLRAGIEAPLVLEAAWGPKRRRCADPRCRGWIVKLWWIGSEAVFQRREGVNRQADAFHAWQPSTGRVRTIRASGDEAFDLCASTAMRLVCRLEQPARPGRLVRLDVANGAVTTVADPNPALGAGRFGRVLRIDWADDTGRPRFGYLSLPPDGTPAPLVIVQYRARGFQRGGVGDEYPIAAFAAAGLAVLNVDRPNATDLFESIADPEQLYRAVVAREPVDRMRLHAGLLAGIACVSKLGLADTTRLGIGGLSDGAVMTYHALTQDSRFAAAIVSSPGWDPSAWFLASAANRRQNAAAGFSDPHGAAASRWAQVSPARRASRLRTPLLLNLADHELGMTAEFLAALEVANAPHEAHVYADEFHLKWQPAHRLSIYRRNVDWYRFWLLDQATATTGRADQFRRWRALRAAAPPRGAQPAMPAPRACQARSQLSTAR